MLFAVDHGNYAIKTVHETFVSGLAEHSTRPPMADEVIEYDGKFWTLSGQRLSYMRDKTRDDRFFILTLFAIAKEMKFRGKFNPIESVDLAVGLPPEHYGLLRNKFAQYFKRPAPVKFVYNDTPISIIVKKRVRLPAGICRNRTPEKPACRSTPYFRGRYRRLHHGCSAPSQWPPGYAVLPQPRNRCHHHEQRHYPFGGCPA